MYEFSIPKKSVGYIVPALVGLCAAVIVQAVPIDDANKKATLTVVISILSTLFSAVLYLASRTESSETKVLEAIGNDFKFQYFHTTDAAVEHITHNAGKCSLIMNTRLNAPNVASIASNAKRVSAHDKAIVEAVKAGCRYWLVYERRRAEDITYFVEEINKAADANPQITGPFSYCEVQCGDFPALQMTILCYKNGVREALVGWPMGNTKTPYLFEDRNNDRSPIGLFERIFMSYWSVEYPAPAFHPGRPQPSGAAQSANDAIAQPN